MAASDHKNDLPLMANSSVFHLYHYVLDLTCNFDDQVFSGNIILFLNPIKDESETRLVFSIQEYQKQMQEMCQTRDEHMRTRPNDGGSQCKREEDIGETVMKKQRLDLYDHEKSEEIPLSETNEELNLSLSESGNKRDTECSQDTSGISTFSGSHGSDTEVAAFNSTINVNSTPTSNSRTLDASTTISNSTYCVDDTSISSSTTVPKLDSANDHTPSINSQQPESATLNLDACDIDVISVYELDVSEEELINLAKLSLAEGAGSGLPCQYMDYCEATGRPLPHLTEKWCIKIWKDGVKEYTDFPRVVKIQYSTRPNGASLRWVLDQDKKPCVFTAAMWVNNRAFFPTAEYGNLSTWQCRIKTPDGATALMSSDNPEEPKTLQIQTEWYHECSTPLPPYTLAIAVGFWHHHVLAGVSSDQVDESPPDVTCRHAPRCRVPFASRRVLPCRVWGARSVVPRAARLLYPYWPRVCRAAQELLGACPFPHVDLLVYPESVQDMALSNPGLIFLSQSLLAEDGSMNVRLGHELSHSWFGLLLGAKDWTEEWLSEGFATFMEDAIHAAATGWSEEEEVFRGELRALIRHKALTAEMENTQNDLQTLRPDPSHETRDEETSIMYVKNGLNPNKQFTQVHYLKGYFLLRHLSKIIGVRRFNSVLKSYIETFHGQLVLSKDFLNHVFKTFPVLEEAGLSVQKIYSDWLDVPGMPKVLQGFQLCRDNRLYSQVVDEVAKWQAVIASQSKKKSSSRRKATLPSFVPLEADQLVLLLEELLAHPDRTLQAATLRQLKQTYTLQAQNADVRHRWCELVVKHHYRACYEDVRLFLQHDQAMGVYLYGELVLSGCKHQKTLAEQSFQRVGPQMEEGTRNTVRAMLYGETKS